MARQPDLLRDVVVVGGGAAGLSAALTLARARRSPDWSTGSPTSPECASSGGTAFCTVPTATAGKSAIIETDQFGATSVPGVWAAGNSSDIGAQIGAAAAAGALAAQHINTDLVMKDLDRAVAAAAHPQ